MIAGIGMQVQQPGGRMVFTGISFRYPTPYSVRQKQITMKHSWFMFSIRFA
jgi:hypothetical protein